VREGRGRVVEVFHLSADRVWQLIGRKWTYRKTGARRRRVLAEIRQLVGQMAGRIPRGGTAERRFARPGASDIVADVPAGLPVALRRPAALSIKALHTFVIRRCGIRDTAQEPARSPAPRD
jgi:hypothetical protein